LHRLGRFRFLRQAGFLALAVPPLLAAWCGAPGPLGIDFNLGPGDGAYISGFHPAYEIDDRLATHWTTYDASVSLPLKVRGGPVKVSYRYARVLPQTAVVEVSLADLPIDRFEARGGGFEERRAAVPSMTDSPLRVRFLVDSHDRRNMGLKLDWIRVDVGDKGRVRLDEGARWRPALLPLLIFGLLLLAGWRYGLAFLLSAPWALATAAGLRWDPWTTHWLLQGVPLALGVFGLAGVFLGRTLLARGLVSPPTLRNLAALAMTAFLLRAAAVNMPGFYHPDLRTHARFVETVREAGFDFLRSPAPHIWKHGTWRTEALGRVYAFPYTPAFHLPFTPLPLVYDDLITAMKLYGAALSTVPLILVWSMARRLEVSPLGAVLMLVIPTYTSRLTFAFLPSLFGHAVEMGFLYWLIGNGERSGARRFWLPGALWVAACQLAYVSGVTHIGVFILLLAIGEAARAREAGWARPRHLLLMALVGSVVSLAVYYRHFLPMVIDLVPRVAGASAEGLSHYPVRGIFEVAYERTRSFFDGIYPFSTAAGCVLIFRRGKRWTLPAAWLSTYLLLLIGRAKIPDLYLHGHETLFVTPLVALASGAALGHWASSRGWRRWAARGLLVALIIQGLAFQWEFSRMQLANAR
jgi:hypothetical protein